VYFDESGRPRVVDMSYEYYAEQEEIETEHLDGLHFDNPHPLCFMCEEDERPESPDP